MVNVKESSFDEIDLFGNHLSHDESLNLALAIHQGLHVHGQVLEISLAKATGLKAVTDLVQGIGNAGYEQADN